MIQQISKTTEKTSMQCENAPMLQTGQNVNVTKKLKRTSNENLAVHLFTFKKIAFLAENVFS
jgi:hypothetical protein